jgi:Ca2+-binding RTX toxin-like protein
MMNQRLAAIGGIGTLLLGLGSGPTAGAPTLCLGEVVTIEGTDDDDRLRGTPGDDVISAGQGWDVIAGLGGNDAICGGGGADRVRGGGGDDQLHGGVDGTRPDPTTRYGDILTGGSGDDVMDGGEGKGSDRVTYGSSRRSIRLDLSTGVATGQGTDTLVAIDNAKGSPFGDHMVAGKAMSFLNGGLGNDRLVSAGGPSFVLGGGGEDHLRMPRGGNWHRGKWRRPSGH